MAKNKGRAQHHCPGANGRVGNAQGVTQCRQLRTHCAEHQWYCKKHDIAYMKGRNRTCKACDAEKARAEKILRSDTKKKDDEDDDQKGGAKGKSGKNTTTTKTTTNAGVKKNAGNNKDGNKGKQTGKARGTKNNTASYKRALELITTPEKFQELLQLQCRLNDIQFNFLDPLVEDAVKYNGQDGGLTETNVNLVVV